MQTRRQPTLPLLPYAGTSGWSGTDTSKAAAQYLDLNGITAASQRGVWTFVAEQGYSGATVKEIRETRPVLGHHGRVSGALSILHKEGILARLALKRDRCHVYVLPDLVLDRETQPPKVAVQDECPMCGRSS